MRRASRWWPRRIAAQLAALMVFAVIVFNVLMTMTFHVLPALFLPPQALHDGRGPDPRSQDLRDTEPWRAPGERRFAASEDAGRRPHGPPPFLSSGPLLATFLFLSISVSTLGVWAARALIAPLQKVIRAAEQFRAGGGILRLEERGPTEIRALARAMNEMQTRITDLVGERTRMLAAIGHDLRTPITRLRLRAEFLTGADEQARMLADLDHMEALVRNALLHLHDGRTGEADVATDLSILVQTIADQFGDLGQEVAVAGLQHVVVLVRPHEFQRAVTNLVENAIRYGRDPAITLASVGDGLEVRVEDGGPGMSDDMKQHMLEPFARGDAARSMNAFEGFGLGLSIARQIAEAHGGRLELRDRLPMGLAAVIVLPGAAVVRVV